MSWQGIEYWYPKCAYSHRANLSSPVVCIRCAENIIDYLKIHPWFMEKLKPSEKYNVKLDGHFYKKCCICGVLINAGPFAHSKAVSVDEAVKYHDRWIKGMDEQLAKVKKFAEKEG